MLPQSIRARLKRFPFLESNFTLAPTSALRFITGPLKNKILAIFLGTQGIGYLGTGGQAQTLGVSLASLSMNTGFTVHMSQAIAKNNHREKRDLLATMFTLLLIFSGVLILIGLLFSRSISGQIFGKEDTSNFLVPIILSVPLISICSTYFIGILYAHGHYERYTRALTYNILIEVLLYYFTAKYFGISGAFWGIFLSSACWFLFMTKEVAALEPLTDVFRIYFSRHYAKILLATGGIMLAAGTSTYFVNILIRILIAKHLGDQSNGIFQVLLVVTAYYAPFLTSGTWARLFPKVGARGASEDTIFEWRQSLMFSAILAASVQISILVIPTKLISIFYTKDFLPAAALLPLQLMGDFFFLLAQPCLAVMLGLYHRRIYLGVCVGFNVIYLFFSWALINRIGLFGISAAYLIGNLLLSGFCLGYYLYMVRKYNFRTLDSKRLSTYVLIPLVALSLQIFFYFKYESIIPRALLFCTWCTFLVLGLMKSQFMKKAEPASSSSEEDLDIRVRRSNTLYEGNHLPTLFVSVAGNSSQSAIDSLAEIKQNFMSAQESLLLLEFESGSSDSTRLTNMGFNPSKLLAFEHSTARGLPPSWTEKDADKPITTENTVCQNDFELIQKARQEQNADLFVFDDSGNLLWGWKDDEVSGRLRLGGLVMNRPHAFHETLSLVRQHGKITSIVGHIHETSPFVTFLSPSKKSLNRELWILRKTTGQAPSAKGSDVKFHVLSPIDWEAR